MSQEKEKACEITESLLTSNECYLDKVIELWRIGSSLYGQVWDTEFHIFGVIESETDHLPTEKVRAHCSKEWLAKADQEIESCISFYSKEVAAACNDIISKYGNA